MRKALMYSNIFPVFVFLILNLSAQSTAQNLWHPGILHSGDEIAFVKAQIAAGKQPWKTAFDRLKSDQSASLSYRATPFRSVDCGYYNQPNNGCNQMRNDGLAAYTQALLFVLTDDIRHADKAISIMDAWASTYQQNTDRNARLIVGWSAPYWANAGELLRAYPNSGWREADLKKFTEMLDKFLPYVKAPDTRINNWMQSRIEATMAIAVFKDDKAELNAAIARWNEYLPIYIWQASDGKGKIDGTTHETCRDLGHLNLGFGSMMYAAETAWKQGVDLFKPNIKRLTDFMELHAGWMTGSKAVPQNICGGRVRNRESDAVGISPPRGGGQKAWEIAYNHLNQRLGIPLPYTRQMILAQRPSGPALWVFKYETLMFAERPIGAIRPPLNIINQEPRLIHLSDFVSRDFYTLTGKSLGIFQGKEKPPFSILTGTAIISTRTPAPTFP